MPITGQTLVVLLVGAALGAGLGGLSMALYLAQGALGLPLLRRGLPGAGFLALSSATGGYLWAFVLSACVVGWLAGHGWDRSVHSSIGAMFLGEVVIYLVGIRG